MPLNIDLSFLKRQEGNESTAVVPRDTDGTTALGHSGVTIGVGVDLGQQTEKGLKELGLSPDTVRKLKPYLGLQGEDAIKAIESKPLVLDEETTDIISSSVINEGVEKTISAFNKGSTIPFQDLTSEQQTTIYSVMHQYGHNGAPKFLEKAQRAAETGDWNDVATELNNFGDSKNVSRLARTVEYMGPQQIEANRKKVI